MIRLFGFDVRITTGFLIFVGLIVMLYQNEFGFWLAAMLSIFTLIHEFGHAVVARSFGADASISLGFMAGYTSYSSGTARQMTPTNRALISLAGPAVQIAASAIVLLAMGVNPFEFPRSGLTNAQLAIWWAGPFIGVLNLIPVLPLDGGHLVQNVLTGILKRSILRPMAIASLVVTGGFAVFMYLSGMRAFTLFVIYLLLAQFQLVQATGSKPVTPAKF